MNVIKVIDYGAGNLHSVLNSLRAVANADEEISLCKNAKEVKTADRVILPGVGAYRACREGIDALEGMFEALNAFALSDARPFLGICVGMQLVFEQGEEHGVTTQGFGWLKGGVQKISPKNADAKIPHMGWNDLTINQPHPVLGKLETGCDVYFVHSYAAQDMADEEILATTDYYGTINAAVGRDNIFATQFHPEKSQKNGLQILRNFLDWQPA